MQNYIQLGPDKISISNETAENLRKQFAEPKREIRHGELAIAVFPISPPAPRLFIKRDHKIVAYNSRGVVMHPDMNESPPDYTLLDLNIFDLMAEAAKGQTEYYVQGVSFGLGADGLINFGNGFAIDSYWRDRFLKAVVSLVVQAKLAEAKKC